MRTVTSICAALARSAVMFAVTLSTAAPVRAADWSYRLPEAPSTFTTDVGLRLWYGNAKTGKNLYDNSGSELLSRLTYDGASMFNTEAFTRFDFDGGWFLKGYAGGGALWGGRLKDEDFPSIDFNPYSATLSKQNNGSMIYGSVDAGFKWLRGPDFHVGSYVGYHILRQVVSAYGCTQIASNPDVCPAGVVPDNVNVITQTNDWHSLRVGLDASVNFNERWKLSVDAAYLPLVHMSGSDAHWLRIGTSPGDFTGPVPEDGNGWGYQLEGFVSYRVNEWVNVGVGGRYWHMQTSGFSHFEDHVVDFTALPQVVSGGPTMPECSSRPASSSGPIRCSGRINAGS